MRRAAGYTYMTVLFVVAIMGVGLALVGEVWHTAALREKEAELLFVGNQYRRAITLYYENTADKRTCPAKCYPEKLEDLLEDKRHLAKKKYLRKLYPDPLTGKMEWGLVAAAGGIMGVYSLSGLTPIKTSGFRERDKEFEGANHFSDWKFLHKLTTPPPTAAPGKPSSTTQAPFTAPPGTPLQPPAQSIGAPAAR